MLTSEERSQLQQEIAARRATPYDVPMGPLNAEDISDEDIIRLYTAVIRQAKIDYVAAKKRLIAGFHDRDKRVRTRKKNYCTKTCTECIDFFRYIGLAENWVQRLVADLDHEVEEWYKNYTHILQARAAKQWANWGQCLDDDVY